MPHAPDNSEQLVRVMQILAGALVAGVVFFAALSVLALGALSDEPDGEMLSLLAAGLSFVAFFGHLIVPRLIVRQSLGQVAPNDLQSLFGVYQTQMIVGLAMLEGVAFFNIIACIVEHNWWSLALAGCLVMWMLIAFPSQRRVEQWIETQRMNLGADGFSR